jgi:hypothetical protein
MWFDVDSRVRVLIATGIIGGMYRDESLGGHSQRHYIGNYTGDEAGASWWR